MLHNNLWEGDSGYLFNVTEINNPLLFATQSYTTLIQTGPHEAVVAYNHYYHPNDGSPGCVNDYPCDKFSVEHGLNHPPQVNGSSMPAGTPCLPSSCNDGPAAAACKELCTAMQQCFNCTGKWPAQNSDSCRAKACASTFVMRMTVKPVAATGMKSDDLVSRVAVLVAGLLVQQTQANMPDIVMPTYVPACECAAWTGHGETVDRLWASPEAQVAAGSSCAMPANRLQPFRKGPVCVCKDGTASKKCTANWPPGCNVTDGSGCSCDAFGANTSNPASCPCTSNCNAALKTPEQINLQLAGPDVVVASFVTFDTMIWPGFNRAGVGDDKGDGKGRYSAAPEAMMITEGKSTAHKVGVAHQYTTSHNDTQPKRNYTFNFVALDHLEPRAKYSYKVRAWAGHPWSDVFSFRAPYKEGPTRIALFGDMGNTQYNNMKNLAADCDSGRIDAIVHMGDHACKIVAR